MHSLGVATAGVTQNAVTTAAAASTLNRKAASHSSKTLPPRRLVCRASGSDSADDASSSSSVPDTLPLVAPGTDWRAFRAQLVASAAGEPSSSADEAWAHPLTSPEPGSLLLANPLMFGSTQTYFHLAAILIITHDSSGTVGIIINKPTQHRIGDLATCNLQPHFDHCTLYLGGDIDPSAVHILHPLHPAACPGAVELLPGVHLGGFDGVRRALAEGRAVPDRIKVLTRYAGWAPGQLEGELRRGVWYCAAASPHVVLQPTAVGAGEEVWHTVMQLMGGEYAQLSAAVKERLGRT